MKACQNKYVNTHKDTSVFSVGSTVALQHADRGPHTYGVMEEANGSDHRG